VSFKTFGNFPITMAFMALQVPLLRRHIIEDTEGSGRSG
jgi:intracellular septation protein A